MRYFRIVKFNTTESTNLELRERCISGRCNRGDVVWSLVQTKGRGQQSSQWLSEPSKNLTFSLYEKYDEIKIRNPFLISCIVSLAVKETLEFFGIPKVFIKWPNDILSANRKLCGILIENRIKSSIVHSSIIGIGINVNQVQFKNLSQATSMQLILKKSFDIEQVLNRFLTCFSRKVNLLRHSEQDIISVYERSLYQLKKRNKFESEKGMFTGSIEGVTTQGFLKVLNKSNQLELFNLKEIKMKL